ncbi:uncharacterized protein LOC107774697 [Nicotiana tabacum]|uniref:Uncharacterized protein LOC107774697 n=1 Tax=Nicotiana tabacum TaxID=4097 RepID=A0A1S3YCT1_TOBAC|nr:PREDICTED: uncharacterized protein LOC107774697 [Nicotiana tabacum]
MSSEITLDDLHLFHKIDREVFTRLVVCLSRDPGESLLIMAMWLWLEDVHYPSIIEKMVKLPDEIANNLAEEGATCLKWLESKVPLGPNDAGDMPFTAIILKRTVSFTTFYQQRFTMISGIKTFLNKVCAIIFADILQHILPGQHIIPIPGFPHPTFGAITVVPRSLDSIIQSRGLWGWSVKIDAPVDDRTMFLTFSRGFPVTEAEVRELFNSYYGIDCVEHVHMVPSASSSDHSLYARMVVRDVSIIDRILSRGYIAKFRVNGKHVWARKYERRDHLDKFY